MNEMSMKYDFAFIGAGISTTVMLMQLKKRGLLESKRVLLLDSNVFSIQNKSLCYWCNPDESIYQDFNHLIEKNWRTVRKNTSDVEKLESFVYCQTSAASLVSELKQMTSFYHFDICYEFAEVFETDENGRYMEVNGEKVHAAYWFDSRPPKYDSNNEVTPLIYQSFLGLNVKLNQPHTMELELMDFNVPQDGYTQFMYILPTTEQEALIEFTRFGDCELHEETAHQRIVDYISTRFGEFEIVSQEKGCIPMTQQLMIEHIADGVIELGSRAGLIKSTTGYVLKNMHAHASFIGDRISENLHSEQIKMEWNAVKKPRRFHFYDGLLLSILKYKPNWGKSIFQHLTQKGSWDETFHFLDEKSTLGQEAKIFSKLPILPFLWATARCLNNQNFRGLSLLIILSVIFLLVSPLQNVSSILSGIVLGIGMITIGIPHGALDHLLVPIFKAKSSSTQIIVKYIIHMFLMFALWYFSPFVAFLIFLMFSAWHFGESDGESWGLKRTESFLWGLFFFYFLLGTHNHEAFQIVHIMTNKSIYWTASWYALIPVMIYFTVRKKGTAALLCVWLYLATFLPLVLAFGLYFIIHHSHPSWKRIQVAISKTGLQMWMKALPFQIGAWIFFVFCIWFLQIKSYSDLNEFYALIFVFIACISWPHAWVMTQFYAARKGVFDAK